MKTATFKAMAFSAMLAGVLAFPLAGANAEGTKTDSNASATTSTQPMSSTTFKSLDADKSGSLSEAEFDKLAHAPVTFKQADTNNDGKITLSELRSAEGNTSHHAPMAE